GGDGRDGRLDLGLLDHDPVGLFASDRAGRDELARRTAELDLEPPAAVVGPRPAPQFDRAPPPDPRPPAGGDPPRPPPAAHPPHPLPQRPPPEPRPRVAGPA